MAEQVGGEFVFGSESSTGSCAREWSGEVV